MRNFVRAALCIYFCLGVAYGAESNNSITAPTAATSRLADQPFDISVNSEAGELEIQFKGKRLLVYAFAGRQFKPYVRALHTLDGVNVLRDAPADHLHHHGLMYAIRVNGINFWEETPAAGIERSVRILRHETFRNPAGQSFARFSQLLHWIDPKDKSRADTAAAALLVETRTLTVSADETRQEVALEWHSAFQAGAASQKVVLSGSNYNGLGLRFPTEFDGVSQHWNSAGPVLLSGTSQNVAQARWSAISPANRDTAVTVVLMGYPGNARGDAHFFTMVNPFAYLAATQALDQSPLTYSSGEKFQARYLVLVYPRDPGAQKLEERYRSWVKP